MPPRDYGLGYGLSRGCSALRRRVSLRITGVALQARIDQLKSQVALASLAVSLERKRVLGPLALLGNGVARAVSKLFVIH